MSLKMHVEVRQADVAMALENLINSVTRCPVTRCPVYYAIMRAIGHSVPMTVHYTGIRVKLLSGEECGYRYHSELTP